MLSSSQRRKILRLHLAGKLSLQQIGDLFGITRERVRQIARDGKAEPRRVSRQREAAARKDARQRDQQIKQNDQLLRVLFLNTAWNDGFSFGDFAKIFGYRTAQNAASRLHWYRRRYGLFTYRDAAHWRLQPDQASRRKEKASKLWKAGRHVSEIVQQCGYSNIASLRSSIHQFRRKDPQMFPTMSSRCQTRGIAIETSAGVFPSIAAAARHHGIRQITLVYRVKAGWPKERLGLKPKSRTPA